MRLERPAGGLTLADFGPAMGTLRRVVSHLFHASDRARDLVEGRLPDATRAVGFADVREAGRRAKPFGTLYNLAGSRAGVAPALKRPRRGVDLSPGPAGPKHGARTLPRLPRLPGPPASSDPEEARVAALVRTTAGVVGSIAVAWCAASVALPHWLVRIVLTAPALLGAAASIALVARGRARAAGWTLALSMWLALTAGLVVESQLFSAAGYVVTIFAAGMMLGGAGIAVAATLAIAATAVLGVLHERGALAAVAVLDTPRMSWLGGLLAMLAGAALVAVSVDRMQRALERARRNEQALARRNRELAASEERFRLLAENAGDVVLELDGDGRFTYVSPSFESVTGDPPERLVGRRSDDVAREAVHPDDLPALLRDGAATREGDESGPLEYRYRTRDGRWIWFETRTRPYRTADGELRAIAVARDASERRKAIDALRESERRLRALIERSPFPIAVYRPDGTPLQVNRAFQRIFGMTPEKADRFLAEHNLFTDERIEALGLRGELERARAGEVIAARELAWPAGRGGWGGRGEPRLWLNIVFYPLKDAEGRVEQFVLMLEDTTDARRMEEQLRQAHKMEALGTLAGGIAHDLNNVLSPILGYAELALEATPAGGANAGPLAQILESAERAKALVRQILAFSRTGEPERRPLALRGVVQEALGLLRASLPATTEIRTRLARGNDTVVGNPTELYQAVLNLCTNAAQALDDQEGTIEVALEPVDLDLPLAAVGGELRPGAWLRFCVRDDGHGMDEGVQQRIFDPFFTTKRESQGTGLGLAVVYGIITRHGGRMRVESAPGKGSAFEIWLPRAPAAVACAAAEAPDARDLRGGERILIVDDEPAVGRVLGDALAALGYRVRVETDPRVAQAAFAAAPGDFDLVITDETMPGLTGEALARELQALRPGLPILLCTGFSARLDGADLRALGIRECLLKPLRGRELAAAVRRALDAGPPAAPA
jgi:PAS domain S-box-containing protein